MQGIFPHKRPRSQLGEGMQRKQVGRTRTLTQAPGWGKRGPGVSKGEDPTQPKAPSPQVAVTFSLCFRDKHPRAPHPPPLGSILRESGVSVKKDLPPFSGFEGLLLVGGASTPCALPIGVKIMCRWARFSFQKRRRGPSLGSGVDLREFYPLD